MIRELGYEAYKQAVADEARNRLKGLDWFRGLVLGSIQDSWVEGLSVGDAALQVELETAYHDRPGGLFGDCGDGLGLRDEEDEEDL
jgi:hypothetical protein